MTLNEAETRAEYVDPAIASAHWGKADSSTVRREFQINLGRIQSAGKRAQAQIADYVLEMHGQQLAVIEAKRYDLHVTEGLAQAKTYAQKLDVRFAISTNGREVYLADLQTGAEGLIDSYPTPVELWEMSFAETNAWMERFREIPFEEKGGSWQPRYYQQIAIDRVLQAIADGDRRILLTLATGTGKTAIAFQIAWKLFQARWNLTGGATRRPRILFLADRNILADQAFNAFGAFPEDAMVRIRPGEIKKRGGVPKNASIFFTIFQTFMTEQGDQFTFGEYPPDFFDFIVIDECHRGGASDESSWRGILDYFEPAVQLGLTATPRRDINVDTYNYFGDPVYTYSLKDGIEDGFLTPFRVRQFDTTIDEYVYVPGDEVLQGEVEPGRTYTESDFNRAIRIDAREAFRVKLLMDELPRSDKTLVFCANQEHALIVRDLINQSSGTGNPDYCHRVTANDGEIGEQYLRQFQDNEKTIPTVLTTSRKLSTGVDARNVRNIVLLRPIKSMIEFKQIVGRGTRLYEGKDYFTIWDFVEAYRHFQDPEWDGEPEPPTDTGGEAPGPRERTEKPTDREAPDPDPQPRERLVIKLRDGRERTLQAMSQTLFYGPDGSMMNPQQFIEHLFDTLTLPQFFSSEEELRNLWSDPVTRRELLQRLAEAGFPRESLEEIQVMIDAADSDLFDVLEYIAFATPTVSRSERVESSRPRLVGVLTAQQMDFIDFVLGRYEATGVEELDLDKLPMLLQLKYQALQDGMSALGGAVEAREVFTEFQRVLYDAG